MLMKMKLGLSADLGASAACIAARGATRSIVTSVSFILRRPFVVWMVSLWFLV